MSAAAAANVTLAAAPAASSAAPLRILCLHGFFQSAPIFRMKTAALRKVLKNVASLEYIQAPHALSDADQFRNKPADGVPPDCHFTWWRWNQGMTQYSGWVSRTRETWREVECCRRADAGQRLRSLALKLTLTRRSALSSFLIDSKSRLLTYAHKWSRTAPTTRIWDSARARRSSLCSPPWPATSARPPRTRICARAVHMRAGWLSWRRLTAAGCWAPLPPARRRCSCSCRDSCRALPTCDSSFRDRCRSTRPHLLVLQLPPPPPPLPRRQLTRSNTIKTFRSSVRDAAAHTHHSDRTQRSVVARLRASDSLPLCASAFCFVSVCRHSESSHLRPD